MFLFFKTKLDLESSLHPPLRLIFILRKIILEFNFFKWSYRFGWLTYYSKIAKNLPKTNIIFPQLLICQIQISLFMKSLFLKSVLVQ